MSSRVFDEPSYDDGSYDEDFVTPRGLSHGARSGLHQVAPIPGQGAVVGGRARFNRSDEATERHSEVTPHLTHRVGLTARDVVVLRFLAEGWTTSEIAHELAYAESTIKKEVHIIVHRLGARNRTHAVAVAIRGAVI